MGATQRMFDYKADVADKIVTNQNILKAITITDSDFLDKNLPDGFNGDSLIYAQVFPYLPISSQFNEAKVYITISLGRINSNASSYTDGSIIINIICPFSIVRTDLGQRHGFIADEIDKMMFETRGFGLGKVSSKTIDEIIISGNSEYIGVSLKYYITDFAK